MIMQDEDLVENWCFELNLINEGWNNSGEFGHVFNTTDNKVIKITSDHNEFIQTFNLLNKNLDFHPKVYDMRVFPNGALGILMDHVVVDDIEDVFAELSSLSHDLGVDITSMDEDECRSQLSPEGFKMFSDICRAEFELRSHGHIGSDIHEGNIGINDQGNYVLFDQTLKNQTGEYNEDVFEDIKEKLMLSYEIDKDNPIIKKDVCISKILVHRDAINKAIQNISQGKISKSKGHLECMYNSDGNLQLINSHDKFCEELLQSNETVSIKITFDERAGHSHPSCLKIDIDDSLDITPDYVYGGLENLVDDDSLERYLAKYNDIKKKSKKRKRTI